MPDLFTVQVVAGGVTVLLVAVAAIGLVRLSSIPSVVLITSLLAAPIAAFAVDAFAPRPPGSSDIVFLALPFALIALIAIAASLATAFPRRRIRTFASLHRRALVTYLIWPSLVVAVSVFVFVFEPAFAIANVVANVAWFVVWIPRATRRYTYETSYSISAPRDKVFSFVTQPANWPLYRIDIEGAEVDPPGAVGAGSELVTRLKARYPGLRGPRMTLPDAIEIKEVVTEFVPNERVTSRRNDLIDVSATMVFSSQDGGTQVRSRITSLVPYRYAVLGLKISYVINRARRLGELKAQQGRLRALLEKPAAEA